MKYETPKTDTPRTDALLNLQIRGLYPRQTQLNMLKSHAKGLERELNMALDRIRDLLMEEDGHAQREAEKFLKVFEEFKS